LRYNHERTPDAAGTMADAACDKNTTGNDAGGLVQVDGPNVRYSKEYIESTVDYPINYAVNENGTTVVTLAFTIYYYISIVITLNKFYMV